MTKLIFFHVLDFSKNKNFRSISYDFGFYSSADGKKLM